ncbi:hypothetical protein D9M68_666880 [compost metagenome]
MDIHWLCLGIISKWACFDLQGIVCTGHQFQVIVHSCQCRHSQFAVAICCQYIDVCIIFIFGQVYIYQAVKGSRAQGAGISVAECMVLCNIQGAFLQDQVAGIGRVDGINIATHISAGLTIGCCGYQYRIV